MKSLLQYDNEPTHVRYVCIWIFLSITTPHVTTRFTIINNIYLCNIYLYHSLSFAPSSWSNIISLWTQRTFSPIFASIKKSKLKFKKDLAAKSLWHCLIYDPSGSLCAILAVFRTDSFQFAVRMIVIGNRWDLISPVLLFRISLNALIQKSCICEVK